MWRLDIPPLLVHGIFLVSLTTTAGLLAVWAALSSRHRLLRLTGFCALPLALWLASAPELVSHLLVEMAVIAIFIIALPFVARAPYGRTFAKLPKLRFGLDTLFYAIFLVALILAAASLLLPQFAGWTPRHILSWLVERISLSVAIIGATAFAQGGGGWIKRLAALFAGCIAGALGWYVLVFLFEKTPGMFNLFVDYFSIFEGGTGWINTWYVSSTPCVVGILAAGVLWTWQRSSNPRSTTSNPSATSLTRLRARAGFRLAMIACVTLPSCYMYYELVRPIVPPKMDVPSPNGYDQLVAVGKELALPGITAQRRDELLGEARRSLVTPSWVSVDYYAPEEISKYQSLRAIWRVLNEAGDARRLAGDVDAALALYMDTLKLADRTQRGGIVNDSLRAYWSLEGLTSLGPRLSADQCRATVAQLLAYDDNREAPEEILRRDDVHSRLYVGWVGRWLGAVETICSGRETKMNEMAVYEPRKRDQARLRVLACDLAIHAFARERHRLPESLDELVPTFLSGVPIDPFDGEAVKFAKEAGQYTVSALGGGPHSAPFEIIRPTLCE